MGKKLRVVFDTNIWVSIILNKSLAGRLLPLIRSRRVSAYVSEQQLEELARVLTYPKIVSILNEAEIDPRAALAAILRSATLIRSKASVKQIREDPSDNMVLESALSAKAKFIVSGDSHLLALAEFRGIKILKARAFEEIARG